MGIVRLSFDEGLRKFQLFFYVSNAAQITGRKSNFFGLARRSFEKTGIDNSPEPLKKNLKVVYLHKLSLT